MTSSSSFNSVSTKRSCDSLSSTIKLCSSTSDRRRRFPLMGASYGTRSNSGARIHYSNACIAARNTLPSRFSNGSTPCHTPASWAAPVGDSLRVTQPATGDLHAVCPQRHRLHAQLLEVVTGQYIRRARVDRPDRLTANQRHGSIRDELHGLAARRHRHAALQNKRGHSRRRNAERLARALIVTGNVTQHEFSFAFVRLHHGHAGAIQSLAAVHNDGILTGEGGGGLAGKYAVHNMLLVKSLSKLKAGRSYIGGCLQFSASSGT